MNIILILCFPFHISWEVDEPEVIYLLYCVSGGVVVAAASSTGFREMSRVEPVKNLNETRFGKKKRTTRCKI